jgi:hypothetical protein
VAGAEHPEYSELEVNPVLAHPGGATALDAHGVLAAHDNHETKQPDNRQLTSRRR